MAGVGTAWALSVHGPRRFSDVSAAWRTADRIAREAIESRLGALDEWFEGKVFA